MAKIYVGPPSGGSGGGGSVNPTSGTLPVNLLGSFVDSNIKSDAPTLTTTAIDVSDSGSRIQLSSIGAQIEIDGTGNIVNIKAADVNLYNDVNIVNHLGLQLLKFQGSSALFPALKRVSTDIEVRLANDSAYTNITAQDVTATRDVKLTGEINFTAKSIVSSVTNGIITLYNQAKSAFSLLQFGGVSNLFPALKRNNTELQVRLADDSAFAPFRSSTLSVEGGAISIASGAMNIYAGTSSSNAILYGNLAGITCGKGAALAVASAQFEIVSTTKGFLPPRMTNAQRTAIASPAIGLMVYQTDAPEGIWTNKSTGWVQGV